MHTVDTFQKFIWDFYRVNKRPFAWRNSDNPYFVVVSEMMLQQTQTYRVIEKYKEFITVFPTFEALASAQLRDILLVWQGLGYYRRARYLHQIAQIVINDYDGVLPNNTQLLETFPGIGPATAASICAFAFNQSTLFIETNIRTVFIHSFFSDKESVSDKEIMSLVTATVDKLNAREWYYALMDYGVWLKAEHGNANRKSAHYTKQTKFEGSDRQIRAKILKLITQHEDITDEFIVVTINKEIERVKKIVYQLVNEQFIVKTVSGTYKIF
jgi:A/G-specific adenine glycosylase